jgi:hypothetical protein
MIAIAAMIGYVAGFLTCLWIWGATILKRDRDRAAFRRRRHATPPG